MTTKTKNPTALESMRRQITTLQAQQNMMVDDFGIVRPCFRYEYQNLMKDIKRYKQAIEELEKIYNEEGSKS